MTVKQLIEKLQKFNPKLEVQTKTYSHHGCYYMPVQKVAKFKNKKMSKRSDQKTIITIS